MRLSNFYIYGFFLVACVFGGLSEDSYALRVVASIRPLHSLVAALMEGRGYPHLLIDSPICPHGHGWRFSDAQALRGADLVVWVGPEFEGQQVQKALRSQQANTDYIPYALSSSSNAPKKSPTVLTLTDFAERLTLRHLPGYPIHGYDGHFFWDPLRMKVAALIIGEALIAADPRFASLYRKNLACVLDQLDELHQSLEQLSQSIKKIPFWIFHQGYEYFCQRYDLALQGSLFQGHHHNLAPRQMQHLKNSPGRRVFVEKNVSASSKFAPWLQKQGWQLGWIDGLGSAYAPGPKLYVQTMKDLMKDVVVYLSHTP